jgi:hypothetical protein
MPYPDPNPYRWQDHVVTPRRAAVSLMATVLIVLLVGAAAMLAGPSRAPVAHAVAAGDTPSPSQLARQPAPRRATGSLL